MINAIIYVHVSSITNAFLSRSNKVKKQREEKKKKNPYNRNDVWNSSEMLSNPGWMPIAQPLALLQSLGFSRHKREFKEKGTPPSSQVQMEPEEKNHFVLLSEVRSDWKLKTKKKQQKTLKLGC